MRRIGGCFFLSGFAALVYEVLWARQLSLFCGAAATAVAAVTAAIMGGLGLGSLLGGRWAQRAPRGRLLAGFAAAEAGIAAAALLGQGVLRLAQAGLFAARLPERSAWLQSMVCFFVCVLALLPASALMGATLPILARWAARDEAEADGPLGLFYAVNTAGAVCGCLACGFYLVEAWGLRAGLGVAAAANMLAAAGALRARESFAARPERAARGAAPAQRVPLGAMGAAAALGGAGSMVLEAAWTRAAALTLGSSTYAFSTVLAAFLSGLAAGSLLLARARRRAAVGAGSAGALFWAVAALAPMGLPLLAVFPFCMILAYPFWSLGPWEMHAVHALFCAALVLPCAACMGAGLPACAAALAPGPEEIAGVSGGLWAANTAGAAAGAAAAGLALLPAAGLEGTVRAGSALYLAAALCAWSRAPGWGRRAAALATAALALGLAARGPSARVLSSGIFLYASVYGDAPSPADLRRRLNREKVIFSRDGQAATVAVLESPDGERYLRVNGKTDASMGGDMGTQLLIGYLPVLYHAGAPRRALAVGFGSGASAAAMAAAPLERLDIVEIEPAVAEAAPLFERVNRGVLRDPRVRLYVADGRHFLASAGEPYDLISSEPSNPWIAGVANLYTREAFEAARARLAPGGVFLQWFHSYHMSLEDFRTIVRTFSEAFPRALLCWNGEADFFLLGSLSPWAPDYSRISAFLARPRVREDLAAADPALAAPLSLLATTFMLAGADLKRFCAGAPVMVDDRPTLEFSAPRSQGRGEGRLILERLAAAKTEFLPEGLRNFRPGAREKAMLLVFYAGRSLDAGRLDEAEAAFARARLLDPRAARPLAGLGKVAQARGQAARARKLFLAAQAAEPAEPDGYLSLGAMLAQGKRRAEAIPYLERGLALGPADPKATLELAVCYLEAGRSDDARRVLERVLERPVADSRLQENLRLALRIARS